MQKLKKNVYLNIEVHFQIFYKIHQTTQTLTRLHANSHTHNMNACTHSRTQAQTNKNVSLNKQVLLQIGYKIHKNTQTLTRIHANSHSHMNAYTLSHTQAQTNKNVGLS